MPLDPVQRHQIEQDAITAAWEPTSTSTPTIDWADVGTLKHYASMLRQITDSAFSEASHAA